MRSCHCQKRGSFVHLDLTVVSATVEFFDFPQYSRVIRCYFFCRADASGVHLPAADGVPRNDAEDVHSSGMDHLHAPMP